MSKTIGHTQISMQVLTPFYNLIKSKASDNEQSITDLTINAVIESLSFTLEDLFGKDGKIELIDKLGKVLLSFEKDIDVLMYIQKTYNAYHSKDKEQIKEICRQVLYLLYPNMNVVERRKYQKLICSKDELIKELFDEVLTNEDIKKRIEKAKQELNTIFGGI